MSGFHCDWSFKLVAAKKNEAVVIWCTSGLHDIIDIRAAK